MAADEIHDILQDLPHDFQMPSWKGSCLSLSNAVSLWTKDTEIRQPVHAERVDCQTEHSGWPLLSGGGTQAQE